MNESEINNILSKLKSGTNSVVYDGLLVIRKRIIQNKSAVKTIREKSILKDLVGFLHKPNEKILDVTLSILGNCCLEHESRIEVGNIGIAASLASVLHNISTDSIQGRACRLVGNLAQDYNLALELHEKGVISGLVVATDINASSVVTRQMAVRALRVLWNVQSQRPNMLELNAVHKVTKLLATPYDTKEEKELINAVIKALKVFAYQCSERCAQQICDRGTDLQSLLSLAEQTHLKASIFMCISYLCHNASARLILGIAGAVRIVVKELAGQDLSSLGTTDMFSALVYTLCLFCRESVNRAKIRRAGGLPIILGIFRNSSSNSYKTRALHALAHFLYDELSLQELLKEGLVDVLISNLSDFVKENGKIHERVVSKARSGCKRHLSMSEGEDQEMGDNLSPKISKGIAGSSKLTKRFRSSSPKFAIAQQENRMKERSLVYADHPLTPPRWSDSHSSDWSPSNFSCPSPPDLSPPWTAWSSSPSHDASSGASSPLSPISADEEWPVMYSPICHDESSGEEDMEEECGPEEKTDEPICSDKCDSRSSSPELQPLSTVCESINLGSDQNLVLNLLSRVSYMEKPVEDLAVKKSLLTLLDYISLIENPIPKAARILRRIVRNIDYFPQIISHRFVLSLYSRLCRPIHQRCQVCEKLDEIGHSLLTQLSVVSTSGYAEGELSYYMKKSDASVRRMLAVTIPFFVTSQRMLKQYLVKYEGLFMLHSSICGGKTEDPSLVDHVPVCLNRLATSLNIHPPQQDSLHRDEACSNGFNISSAIENITEDPADTLSLILDDGSCISTSRSLLCGQSPVFDAMLQGNFIESTQHSVRLQRSSPICVAHLLYVMKLGRVPHCLPNLTLSAAMELLATLDKFLIPGCEELANLILRQFLNPRTVTSIYRHMAEMGNLVYCDYIRAKTVEFILAAEMSPKERCDMFSELSGEHYSYQAVEDTFHFLLEKLTQPS